MTKIIAHRGASGYAPENTMAAFELALEQGSHGIETDVHLTKDGKMILTHDHILGRTAEGTGELKDFTLEELQKKDWGSWYSPSFKNERLPELKDLLHLLRGKDLYLNLEIKFGTPYYKGLEEKILKEIKGMIDLERLIMSSFNHYSLARIKGMNPQISTGFLTSALLIDGWDYVKKNGGQALHPDHNSVTEDLVKSCHSSQIAVNTYTVNSVTRAEELIKFGVDSIITNYPDKLLAIG
jgi:glycerophosphoryl diester phosphodiesterase